jgi:hypothetical protein
MTATTIGTIMRMRGTNVATTMIGAVEAQRALAPRR